MNIFQKINRELKWINFAIFFSRKSKELDKDKMGKTKNASTNKK